jgi:hypothetical protein
MHGLFGRKERDGRITVSREPMPEPVVIEPASEKETDFRPGKRLRW